MEDQSEARLYSLIGARISKARTEKGYTQKELSASIGLTRTSVVNIEKGRHRIPLHTLFTVAIQLGKEPKDLIPTLQEIKLPSSINNLIEHLQPGLDAEEKASIAELLKKAKQK